MEDARQASVGIVNGQRLYNTTPEIQAFADINSAAEYFQYTNQWGVMVTPIDKDSFNDIKLSVLRELSEGIKWARDNFNIGSAMPRAIRRESLGKGILGDYDDIGRVIRLRKGLTLEYAYSTAVHEMAHHADNLMGHPSIEVVREACRELRKTFRARDINRMMMEIAGKNWEDPHEVMAYSLDKACLGKGNELAKKIASEFIRRCASR